MIRRNLLRLLSRVAAGNFRESLHPYKLNFIVTDRCNCRCLACRIWEKEGEVDLTTDEIKTFFDRSRGFSWVDVSGGEIFLRPDIVEIFSIIVEKSRHLALLHFPTNGLLTERILECTREILAFRPPRLVVTVSIDGPPRVHDEIRGVKGCFAQALETYVGLKKLPGVAVYLGMTLMSENIGTFDETLAAVRRAAPSTRAEDFHFNVIHHSSHYYGNTPPRREDTRKMKEELLRLAGRRSPSLRPMHLLERQYLSRLPRFLESGRSPLPCRALADSIFLSAEGIVYPCTIFDKPLGSLRDSGYDLKEILDTPLARRTREIIQREGCPGCWTACEAFPAIAGNLFRLRR